MVRMFALLVAACAVVRVAPLGAAVRGDAAVWRLSLNVGRERGTWMPEDWAKSGARLLLPVEAEFTAEQFLEEPEPLVGRTCFVVKPLGDATFVGAGGTVRVPVRRGAWSVTPPEAGKRPALLRFWLDFPEECARNDVVLPAGRVFFNAPVWQQPELERGETEAARARAALEAAGADLEAHVAEHGQDVSPLKVFCFRKRVTLVEAVQRAARRVDLVAQLTPDEDVVPTPGPWPGVAADSSLAVGGGGLVVKRPGRIGVGVEYHILGKCTFAPVEEEEAPPPKEAAA